jgi:gamma-glutamyltranspeptidase/glutathione hydrolase
VPGLLAALELALRRHGSWPLARTLAPAIRLAEEGFLVSPRLHASLAEHRERLAAFPATRAAFFGADGEPPAIGAILRQPALARALRTLAAEGSAVFYRGEIGEALVRAVRESPVAPGPMAPADLAGYRAVLRAPVRATYRGHTLIGMGPPSSGASTVFQLLNLLETQPVSPQGPLSPVAVHRFVQAARLAYADRGAWLGDADFVPVPMAGLLDKGYAARRAATLDWSAPLAPVEAGTPPGAVLDAAGGEEPAESPSTTHLVVVDGARNGVSMTTTIEQAFGSGIVVPGWGFLLNNQLTDFSLGESGPDGRPPANALDNARRPRRTALESPSGEGGKRPRSSMAPTLVLRDGQPVLLLGSPGGSRIIQYVAEVLVRVLDYGMDPRAAIAAPHHTHLGGRTALEQALADGPLPGALERLGHTVQVSPQASGLHAIAIDPATGRLSGAADPRREGLAAGF